MHEAAALKRALETQVRELRGALASAHGDLDKSRAGEKRAVLEKDEAAAAPRTLVHAEILPPYGEGKHPAKTAISNAPDDMFYALSVRGMPFDSNGTERAFHWPLGPFKRALAQAQGEWSMTTAEEILTFVGICGISGIGPADALGMLEADPCWFAAGPGAADAAAAHRGRAGKSCIAGRVRPVRRYRPAGPGPPPAPAPRQPP